MTAYDGCMAVERSRWTDERLDDLAERVIRHEAVGPKVDDLKQAVDDLRREMIGLRSDLTGQMNTLRGEVTAQGTGVRSEINGLRSELYDTRRWLLTMWLSGVLGLAALFVEIALRT